MSIKSTLAAINALPHVKARHSSYMGSEYRVAYDVGDSRDKEEAGAYYTDDAQDALDTARVMSASIVQRLDR